MIDAGADDPRSFADDQLPAIAARYEADFGEADVATMRAGIAESARQRAPGPEMAAVTDLTVRAGATTAVAGGVPARVYRPTAGALPVLLYLHGGGWTIGSIDSHDRMCRRLAARAGVVVVSLGYRLAPEHPWPASVEDTVAALRWIAERPAALGELRPGAAAVAGDSAGATLATLACLRLRDEAPAALPRLQVLIYGNFDLTESQPSNAESSAGISPEVEAFFVGQWVPDVAWRGDPGVSPLFATELAGLPEALIVSAQYDPLRDDSTAYAARLGEAGVPVARREEPGLIHNFMLLDELSPACAAASDRIADEVRERLAAMMQA